MDDIQIIVEEATPVEVTVDDSNNVNVNSEVPAPIGVTTIVVGLAELQEPTDFSLLFLTSIL